MLGSKSVLWGFQSPKKMDQNEIILLSLSFPIRILHICISKRLLLQNLN